MSSNTETQLPISTHIFTLPFTYDPDTFIIDKLDSWKRYYSMNEKNLEDEYQSIFYFHEPCRDIIFSKDSEDPLLKIYHYKLNDQNNAKYNIKVNKYIFSLDIQKIELRLLHNNVGLLSFFLDYHGEMKKNSIPILSEHQQVLHINEHGRKIYDTYLENESNSDRNFPQRSSLMYYSNLFGDNINHKNNADNYYNSSDLYTIHDCTLTPNLAPFITDLFQELESYEKLNSIIKPLIDQRMFVSCLYATTDDADNIRDLFENDGFKDSKLWNQFVFVDSDFISCRNTSFLNNLLEKHTYSRWSDSSFENNYNDNVLYGLSRYSFIALTTSENAFAPTLKKHMETMYHHMLCITLIQRASILQLNRISDINISTNKQTIEAVQKLNLKYIEFINKINFTEVTAQEQGIELYHMLRDFMEIEINLADLDLKFSKLHSYVSMIEDRKLNKTGTLIALIAAIFCFPGFIKSIPQKLISISTPFLFASLFLALISFFILRKSLHQNKIYSLIKIIFFIVLIFPFLAILIYCD